jgi:hypothetical protein
MAKNLFKPTLVFECAIRVRFSAISLGVALGIPALTTRRARTTVELRDGQSFAIAGLLQADSTRLQDQLPWLGSVPVLGALFRSAQYLANETELVVLVTPYLIKPVPPAKKLKTPLDSSLAGNDIDYFLNGQPEVPKTPPFTFNPFGGLAKPVWRHRAGSSPARFPAAAPVPVPVAAPVAPPVPVVVAPAPAPVPAAVVAAPVPAPVLTLVPPGDSALHYDPATSYFIDPPAHGGGQRVRFASFCPRCFA